MLLMDSDVDSNLDVLAFNLAWMSSLLVLSSYMFVLSYFLVAFRDELTC